MKIIFLLLTLITFSIGWSCKWTTPYYRKYSMQIFDWTFPYQTLMAQGAAESHCRKSAISNDGHNSAGIGQTTWKWWKHYLKRNNVPDLKSIENQVKAQVLVDKYYYDRVKCKKLSFMFRAYNGGLLINKEITKAKSCDFNIVRKYCKRKIVHFSNGKTRSACEINIRYPIDIYKMAVKYYFYQPNDNWRFW